MRLLSGLLAGRSFRSALDGDASLRQRPMQRVIDPLTLMGAKITSQSGNGLAPLLESGGDACGRRGGQRPVGSVEGQEHLPVRRPGGAPS